MVSVLTCGLKGFLLTLTASAAGEAVSERFKTSVEAETTPNTQVHCPEALPTRGAVESESSSQPGKA